MKTRIVALTCLAVSLLGSGCASVQLAPSSQDTEAKRFETAGDLSRLYIYRNELLGTLAGLQVSVDGRAAGTTKGMTYLIVDVPEGEHQIASVGENTSTLNIRTQAGRVSYVWQEVKLGLISPRSQLAEVSEVKGRAGVQQSSLAESPLMQRLTGANKPAATQPAARSSAISSSTGPAVASSKPPMQLSPSAFNYEAERAAKEKGCDGPGGVRPQSVLRSRHNNLEKFDVICASRVQRVVCDMGMCRVIAGTD